MTNERDSESSGTKRGGSGNFADDPQKAKEAGRKGGQHSVKAVKGEGTQSKVALPAVSPR